jgi:hypothetical protein
LHKKENTNVTMFLQGKDVHLDFPEDSNITALVGAEVS